MNPNEAYNPGTTIDNRYTIEKVLGQGGMATVYRVRHMQLGTKHALKVLSMPSKSIQKRLLQEGRVQAQLRHPNIVAVTDVVEVEGAPGLVMEYIDGPTLDTLLAERRLTLDQADALIEGILSGVAFAHDKGLVHRDLKPANVLLTVSATGITPKVTDFGLAKLLAGDESGNSQHTRTGLAMGTPAYMAPEQIRDAKGVDQRADVFSMGVILYEIVCGTRPFDGVDMFEVFKAITSGDYADPKQHLPDLPDRMHQAIVGALDVDRERRIQDCHALLRVWQGQASHTQTPAPVGKRNTGPWDDGILQRATTLGSGDTHPSPPSTLGAPPVGTGADGTWVGTPAPAAPRSPTVAPDAGRRSDETWAGATPEPSPVVVPASPATVVEPPQKRSFLIPALFVGATVLGVVAFASWKAMNTSPPENLPETPTIATPEPVVVPNTPEPTPIPLVAKVDEVVNAPATPDRSAKAAGVRTELQSIKTEAAATRKQLSADVQKAIEAHPDLGPVVQTIADEGAKQDDATFAKAIERLPEDVQDLLTKQREVDIRLQQLEDQVARIDRLILTVESVLPVKPTGKDTKPEERPPATPAPVVAGPPGRLSVNTLPWGDLTLDGQPMGPVDWNGEVSPGKHTILVVTPAGKRFERTVTVRSGKQQVVCWDFDAEADCER